jgi:hypothetical protein
MMIDLNSVTILIITTMNHTKEASLLCNLALYAYTRRKDMSMRDKLRAAAEQMIV